MKSSWEVTKEKSKYHFNPKIMDDRWDTIIPLGRFEFDYDNDLKTVIETATPSTWEKVRYWRTKTSTGQISDIRNTDYEEKDIEKAGGDPNLILTNMEHNIPVQFQKMIDDIGLENSYNRIHVQWTGQVFNKHIDKLHRYCPENPNISIISACKLVLP